MLVKALSGHDPIDSLISDDHFVIPVLASLTVSEHDVVSVRLDAEKNELGVNVRRSMAEMGCPPFKWTDQLVSFYQKTDAFLFETLVYNRSSIKRDLRKLVLRFAQKYCQRGGEALRVLAYGDGLGIDSCYLASAGYSVDYFEVSRKCIDFACILKDQLDLQFRVLNDPEQLMDGGYDLVIALDVLEHVPNPPALVKQLAGRLKAGGALIVSAPFWYVDPAVPTHLASNKVYSGDLKSLFAPAGLTPVDCGILWTPIVLIKTGLVGKMPSLLSVSGWKLYLNGAFLALARITNYPHLLLLRLAWLASKAKG